MIEFDEHRYERCSKVPLAMEPLAASLGIQLSDEALHMQRLVFCIGTLFDDTLDSGTDIAQQAVLSYWASLAYGTPAQSNPDGLVLPRLISDLRELHNHLTPSQAASFYRSGEQTVTVGQQCKTTNDPRIYHALRTEEAYRAFGMVVSTIPEPEQQHPNFPRYVHLGSTAGKIAAVLDGVADLREDAREGRTAVRPTAASYVILSQLALRETVGSIREIGYDTTLRIIGRSIHLLTSPTIP